MKERIVKAVIRWIYRNEEEALREVLSEYRMHIHQNPAMKKKGE